ncbi:carbonic anhydrase [Ancylobacter sp. WKF20]|uniref:carbonic anhydrase n=1 Tax=Ancylobacter sp. WKF20 TaxID=3039801 RepID=UPI00243445F5|nr:carbonic anhydrase [Ancylobacter sp. WKF20]WGD30658.1 carbonic anhydrase [Ancylobacter sp. WKF20]
MCDKTCSDHWPQMSRRHLLGAGAASMAFLGGLALPAAAQTDLPPPPNAISPDAALTRLMEGNARYIANTPQVKDFSAGRAARAQAQYPFVGLVSCADSRVAPELAFDQGPGEVFVVRVAGNFVNDDGLASLEYGVKVLGIPLLMVLGHSNCGAVDAAIKVVKDRVELPGHLPLLINAIKPAVEASAGEPGNALDNAIAANVRLNVKRLIEAKPILAEAVAAGKVKVVGAVYDIGTGKVSMV